MAVTKILPRNSRLDVAIKYVLNGDKTDHQVLTHGPDQLRSGP